MSSHRAGAAQTKIYGIVAVNIGKMRAVCLRYEHRKFAGPFFHPIHRYATKQ
jgi:hypothetical protein